MNRSIDELKTRAKKLHKAILSGDKETQFSLKLDHFSHDDIKRKTCLNALAVKLGFRDWGHAKNVLSGEGAGERDMGTLWYSNRCYTLLNNWFASYPEAKGFLDEYPEMYLLPYKKQYMVVSVDFIKTIKVYDVCTDDWNNVQHDLVKHYGAEGWHTLLWQRVSTMVLS